VKDDIVHTRFDCDSGVYIQSYCPLTLYGTSKLLHAVVYCRFFTHTDADQLNEFQRLLNCHFRHTGTLVHHHLF
jgi:hypothetical protein